MNYSDSTQNKNWIFTSENLEKLHINKFEKGLILMKEIYKNLDTKINKKNRINDDKDLITDYTLILTDIINQSKFSKSVKSYSLTYFRRFYLKKTIIDYNPDFLMAAAFYLGMKSAQLDVNIDIVKKFFSFIGDFNKTLNIPNAIILLKYEFYLITILNYDFYVFCPYKVMMGFFYKLKKSELIMSKIGKIENLSIRDLEIETEKFIDKTFATDSIFIYSYSYNSLACLFLSFQFFNRLKGLDITNLDLLDVLELSKMKEMEDFINVILPKIFEMIEKIPQFTREEIREKKSRTTGFIERYKEYTNKLEKDRQNLLTKMNEFNKKFEYNTQPEFAKPKEVEHNVKNINQDKPSLPIKEETEESVLGKKRERDSQIN